MTDWEEGVRDRKLIIVMHTKLALIDRAIARACEFVRQVGLRDHPDLKIVVRELLMNAMVHGNKRDAGKKVLLRMERVDVLRFKIEVKDEGEGFDSNALQEKIMSGAFDDNRRQGLVLLKSLAEGLFFNERGNVVTAFLYLNQDWPGAEKQNKTKKQTVEGGKTRGTKTASSKGRA